MLEGVNGRSGMGKNAKPQKSSVTTTFERQKLTLLPSLWRANGWEPRDRRFESSRPYHRLVESDPRHSPNLTIVTLLIDSTG
jgi:hypothetical protein